MSLRSDEEVTGGSSPEAVEAVTVGSSLGAVTVGWSLQGFEAVAVGRRLYSENMESSQRSSSGE